MSDFKFRCVHCQGKIEAPRAMVGHTADCPHCATHVVIPDPELDNSGPIRRKAPISVDNAAISRVRQRPAPPGRAAAPSPRIAPARMGIPADAYRYPHEESVLYASIFAIILIIIVSLAATFGLALVLIFLVLFGVYNMKTHQASLLGSSVAVSERQFPEIHTLCQVAARRLNMRQPPVYVTYSPIINAYAIGFMSSPSVILHSALVEAMTEEELLCIIGHEFSHIKCGHTTWLILTNGMGGVRIPVVSTLLKMIFLSWSRRCEYTCDRAGLLCSRDLNKAVSTMGKLAVGKELFERLELSDFLEQEQHVHASLMSRLAELGHTHPFLVKRIRMMQKFVDSHIYHDLTSRVN